jgi:hypothetical protein
MAKETKLSAMTPKATAPCISQSPEKCNSREYDKRKSVSPDPHANNQGKSGRWSFEYRLQLSHLYNNLKRRGANEYCAPTPQVEE